MGKPLSSVIRPWLVDNAYIVGRPRRTYCAISLRFEGWWRKAYVGYTSKRLLSTTLRSWNYLKFL